MAEDAQPEEQRWEQASPSSCIELHPRRDRDDSHARNVGLAVPLAAREEGHIVPARRETLGEVAVPALRATHRVGIETVVDEADAHEAISWLPSHGRVCCYPLPERGGDDRRVRHPR